MESIHDFSFEDAIEYTIDLVKINTYEAPGKIIALNIIKDLILTKTNAEVTIYDAQTDEPYLVASLKADDSKFKLLLEGHVDVVSPEGVENPFDAIIKDGIMYGRGTCDMKGGCASMLSAFIAVSSHGKPQGDIYLMYSTDEEYASYEIIKALEHGHVPKVDFAVIAEPTNCFVCNAHKGNAWMDIGFNGKSAHASTPELGINSIHMAAEFISKAKKYIDQKYESQRSEEYGIPTMNIGVIEGGSMPNVVPPFTKIRIDKRYLPGDNVKTFRKEIESIINACEEEDPSFNAAILSLSDWPSVKVEKTNVNLLKIQQSIIDAVGEAEINSKYFSGWGEGGFIEPFGISVIYYGPGDLKFAHTPNEHIEVESIRIAAKAYYALIRDMCY